MQNPINEICIKHRLTLDQLLKRIDLPKWQMDLFLETSRRFPPWIAWRLKDANLISNAQRFERRMESYKKYLGDLRRIEER